MPDVRVVVEAVGWAGAIVLLVAYALLTAGRLPHGRAIYQWMNLAGAAGLMVNAAYHGSWPPVAVNVAWGAIAISSLLRRFARRPARPPRPSGHSSTR